MERGIQVLIEAGQQFGQSFDSTLEIVMEKYSMDMETVQKKMKRYWQ